VASSTEPNLKRGKSAAKKGARNLRHGLLTAGLALIIALIAALASGYLWYTLLYRQELRQINVPGELNRLDTDTREMKQALAAAGEELKSFKETQDALKAALEKIHNDLSRNRTEWVLAEAEQLLLAANNRLQLARDATAALSALRAADRQLSLLANPALLAVRREVTREITLLESLEKTDVSGITLRLASLAETVDRLPLAIELRQPPERTKPEAEGGDKGWQAARGMWRDILGLVRIRTDAETQRPLLPPEQQYFLRENLRLLLYGAQQAILQGNVPTYQQNLKSAARLLKEYFDTGTQAVIAAQKELEKLHNARTVSELPNISGSLEALRRWRSDRLIP